MNISKIGIYHLYSGINDNNILNSLQKAYNKYQLTDTFLTLFNSIIHNIQ